jgi:hypothetical protein
LNAISVGLLFQSSKSLTPPPGIVSGCYVNGLIPVSVCPSSAWYSDSPAAPSDVLFIGIITPCCGPAFVICCLSLTMILEQARGRNYSFVEISKMLTEVGFKNIEKRPLAGPAEIVIGYKK